MNWPEIIDAVNKPWFKPLAESLPDEFSEPVKCTAVLWCLKRFDPVGISAGKTNEDLDLEAAAYAGIHEGSDLYDCIFPNYSSFMAALILDVLDLFGGSKYKRWQSGKMFTKMAYTEVVTGMVETDEDKRAMVMLKKADVFKSLKEVEKELDELSEHIFGTSDSAQLAALTMMLTPEQRAKAKRK